MRRVLRRVKRKRRSKRFAPFEAKVLYPFIGFISLISTVFFLFRVIGMEACWATNAKTSIGYIWRSLSSHIQEFDLSQKFNGLGNGVQDLFRVTLTCSLKFYMSHVMPKYIHEIASSSYIL